MMMNETDVINNIRNSVGIISTETLVESHPYVTDPKKEMARLKSEQPEEYMGVLNEE